MRRACLASEREAKVPNSKEIARVLLYEFGMVIAISFVNTFPYRDCTNVEWSRIVFHSL